MNKVTSRFLSRLVIFLMQIILIITNLGFLGNVNLAKAYENNTILPDTESTRYWPQQSTGENVICWEGYPVILLIVESVLKSEIQSELDQYSEDLCKSGYDVIIMKSEMETPTLVRAYLQDMYQNTEERLIGAILIGNIPYAYQWYRVTYTNPDIPPREDEVISYQYYEDLNGEFKASSGYVSPNGNSYSYDVHQGDLGWEIWVGILPSYGVNRQDTIDNLKKYFAKNHSYRIGAYTIPPGYLEIYEFYTADSKTRHDDILKNIQTGKYAWTPFSNGKNAYIFFDSPTQGLSVDQGYQALSEGFAHFTVTGVHGSVIPVEILTFLGLRIILFVLCFFIPQVVIQET